MRAGRQQTDIAKDPVLGKRRSWFKFERRIKPANLMRFAKHFSVFISSGVPILDALAIIGSDASDRTLKRVLYETSNSLRSGASLSSALGAHSYAFPPFFPSMLRAADVTGKRVLVRVDLNVPMHDGRISDLTRLEGVTPTIRELSGKGARVIVCGPPTLVPQSIERLGVEVAYRLDDILPRCDVINMLRIQFERQRSGLFPSIHEYARLFGMDSERLRRAKPDILLLAPGPINRGVEITPEVADGPHSAILQQVTNGLAVRMAVLSLLCEQPGCRPD